MNRVIDKTVLEETGFPQKLRQGMALKYQCRISDIAKNFSPISEYPTNFPSFSPISEGPTSAQSDIADHGYRTKCPTMPRTRLY
jgi:hypothetical protein